jgi:tetratricopeptide (TPR) repeat protein
VKQKFLFLLILLSISSFSYSQSTAKIKEYKKNLLAKNLPDTAKITRYLDIAQEYQNNEKDSALLYVNKAEVLSFSNNDFKNYSKTLYTKAIVYYYMNDYKSARMYQLKSLEIARKLKDKLLMSKIYNLLGAIAFNEGKYESATNYYNQRLQICIDLKDTSTIIETYYNISLLQNEKGEYKNAISYNLESLNMASIFGDSAALLYSSQGLALSYNYLKDYKNAMFFLKKSKIIAEALNDKYSLSGILIDEANVFSARIQYDSSIVIYNQALNLSKKIKDDYHYTKALNGIATPYADKKEYSKAIDYLLESEKISLKLDTKVELVICYIELSECYYELGNYKEALFYAKKSENLAHEMSAKRDLMDVYKNLYRIYEKFKNTEQAYFYYKKYIDLKDNINSDKQKVEIAQQEFNNEKIKQKQIRAQENELAKTRFEKQRQIRNIILVASGILLILFLFLFRNYRQKQKANIEITEQKKTIEHKNKDILDSINYSKRIQQAILTPVEEVKKLLPESFILFKPKDIVSGDFYFIEPIETRDGDEWIAVAMADCTGHGVPGAFMSIICYNFLKQSLKIKEINGPGEALDFASKELYSFLRFHKHEGNIRDGMDVAFAAINKTKNIISFSGANNPLWIVSKRNEIKNMEGEYLKMIKQSGEYFLYEIKANKQHVGFNEKPQTFITHNVPLMKEDLIYLFTDGYADQFGGPKGKKFKYQQLAELLLDNASMAMDTQHQKLENSFSNWIGDLEQIDDVSLLGIKI